MAYATTQQLSAWPGMRGAIPDDADALLRLASKRVDRLLLGAVYDTDDDGNPTDADLVEAFADATCAQAAYMITTGDWTGAESGLQSQTIGSESWTRAPGKAGTPSLYAPDAIGALRNVGIYPARPRRR